MKNIIAAMIIVFISFPAYAACDSPMNANATAAEITCTTTTGRVAFGSSSGCFTVEVAGSAPVHIKTGSSTVTSATTDNYLAAGKGYVFTKNAADTHISCITDSGTSTIHIQTGTGD